MDTTTQQLPSVAYAAHALELGGYCVIECGYIDADFYQVIVSPTYGTLAEAQAERDRLRASQLEAA